MTVISRYSYAQTIARLSSAIVDAGSTIFATIDQAAAAKGVGLGLRPTTLILFGNPRGGTPLMEAYPEIGLDLPLKLLIWEQDGVARVAFESMAGIAANRGIDVTDARVVAMDSALAKIAAVVTS